MKQLLEQLIRQSISQLPIDMKESDNQLASIIVVQGTRHVKFLKIPLPSLKAEIKAMPAVLVWQQLQLY